MNDILKSKIISINGIVSDRLKFLVEKYELSQIDEILDKISHSGYDSLTIEEKEFLFKVGK